MILGIGVDVLQLSRITALTQRRGIDKLASRILSPQESQQWVEKQSSSDPAARIRFLAVRWAVKEAAYKALYPAYVATWKELTYRSLHQGTKPSLVLHSVHPQQQTPDVKLHVSVSHDGEYVFGSVVAEMPS